MAKKLDQLTTEELGQLFPIIIVDYNPGWPDLAIKESGKITAVVGGEFISRIEHIGSTAVPGLCAKPTIDFLLEITDKSNCDLLVRQLEKIGYHCITKPENPPPHMMFVRGYSESGVTVPTFHIHVRYPGDWDEIVFRDYLMKNQSAASDYAGLKKRLAREFRNDREKYTEAKTDFVKNAVMIARSNIR